MLFPIGACANLNANADEVALGIWQKASRYLALCNENGEVWPLMPYLDTEKVLAG